MSAIRRQTLISSVVIYFGFALGLLNTFLFTRKGGFTEAQYGLTGAFISIANIMYAVASLGMPAFITKFFPYYRSWLSSKQSDMMSWAMLIPFGGFVLVILAGLVFKQPLIDKVFYNSPELLDYYYWTFPFGFGLTFFLVLEAYLWQLRKSVLSNFLKEVAFRALTTVLIVATTIGWIESFDQFVIFYSFTYLALVLFEIVYLKQQGHLHFTTHISKVTSRFKKKIATLALFVWGGGLVYNVANVFDTIVLLAVLPNGMAVAGVFTFAQNITSLVQAPQGGVVAASVGPLSQAWKDKDLDKINSIYSRSSLNQLLFSTALFGFIWLNFDAGIQTFNLKESFLQAKWVFFFLGLARIIDMGTGVNAQIISTSTLWRFEFLSGLLLLALSLPLNYFLTTRMGIVGPAISNLIAFTIYNAVRFTFLWRRYGMQPFTSTSFVVLVVAGSCYVVSYYVFKNVDGLGGIFLRSTVYIGLFTWAALSLRLSPDILPIWRTVKKRLGLNS